MINLLLFSYAVSSQNEYFKNTSREDGLSDNFVKTIEQDAYGYLWFGTEKGLNKYDGYELQNYFHNVKDSSSISNNIINDILYTSNKKLLIATQRGLNIYNYKLDNFSLINQKQRNYFSNLIEDENQNVWAIYGNNNVIKFDKNLNFTENFNLNKKVERKFNIKVTSFNIFEYDDAHLFFYVNKKAFYLFNFNTQEISLLSKDIFNAKNEITKILKIDKNQFWVSTLNGVFIYEDSKIKKHLKKGVGNKFLNNAYVRDLKRGSTNEIWIFTDGGGINIYDIKQQKFRYIKANNRNESSIGSDFLYTSYLAKDATLWIGTIKNGISHNIKKNLFKTYKVKEDKRNSSTEYPVSSLFLDSQNRIWVGSDGNGLYQLKNNNLELVFSDENIKTIRSMNELDSNSLLLGAYKQGLFSFDIKNKKYQYQSYIHKYIDSSKNVASILKNIDEDIIVTSNRSVLFRNKKVGAKRQLELNNLTITNRVLSSFNDKEQDFTLLGCIGVLSKFQNGVINHISFAPKRIVAIEKHQKNEYWLATNKGVCLINIQTKKTHFYAKESGLNSIQINSMIKDNQENLWVGTSIGVSKFDVSSKKFINYNYRNAFKDNQFVNPAVIKDVNGKIYFGGLKGILSFNPEEIKAPKNARKVVFTDLVINYKDLNSKQKVTENYIADDNFLTLTNDQKVVTIKYSTFDYQYPENTLFSYKLEGYDKNWITTKERNLTYMNLPKGLYNLKIKASNEVGEFGELYAKLKIKVLPAWWQTIWFRLLSMMVFLGTIFLGFHLFFKRERIKRESKFEKQALKNEKELNEKQLRFFTNLSHEIRTPLTLIISPIRTIIESEFFKGNYSKDLKLIEKNAQRINKLIHRGIDFRKTQFKEPEIQPVRADVVSFIKEILERFKGYSKVENIKLDFKTDTKEKFIWFDKYMLETIMYNLLSNAFKYSDKGGKVVVFIYNKEKSIEIKVKDFGIGISKEDLDHIFERFFQTKDHIGGSGIGLALTKKFVEAHKGTISVKSKKDKGSSFSIKLSKGDALKNNRYIIEEKNAEAPKKLPKEIKEKGEENNENVVVKDKRILIVEDEPDLREYLKASLSKYYNVVTAENGKIGYDLAIKENFDLILSDVMMPKMNGDELCKLLKQNEATSTVPIVLLTAKTSGEDKIKGYKFGADSYLEKPFQLNVLLSVLESLLKTRSALKSKFLKLIEIDVDKESISNSDKVFYDKIIEIMETYIDDPTFDVTKFSREIGMSKSLIYKRLRKITDIGINDLMLKLRMNKAASMLTHTNKTIQEIALLVGFNSPKYFSTYFKKQFSSSPTVYRKNNKK
ncbi:response regulator [Polaribacter sp.]|uniref:response regulator n=1 Tax=Polaribacter sp. TaxID=1920175 RepID=UPI0025CEFF03|nr:response regulator [Polaribacter sp.]